DPRPRRQLVAAQAQPDHAVAHLPAHRGQHLAREAQAVGAVRVVALVGQSGQDFRTRECCPALASTPSRPPATPWPTASAEPAPRGETSASSTTWGSSSVAGLGTADGAQGTRLRTWPLPCMPAWPSCANASAPAACSRSASRRYAGTTAGSSPRMARSYGWLD